MNIPNPLTWQFLNEPSYRWVLWVGLIIIALVAWGFVLRSFR